MERLNVINMIKYFQIYKFSVTIIKILMGYLMELDKLILH